MGKLHATTEYEVLSPCGNPSTLVAAVSAGANAVYLGLNALNARQSAENFTADNLAHWVEYCHQRGVLVYLTLNTLVKNREFDLCIGLIQTARDALVDAFIVQDIGVIALINQYAPDIPIHLSTQAGIHNAEGATVARSLGVDRIVLSRETLLSDTARIHRECDVQIEAFAHGALCVGFSGNCYLSSFINGGSGNRGKCLQPCRLKYALCDKASREISSGYLLSTRDLMMLDNLDDMLSAGVYSLKIEGRLKSPEYVYTTTSAYVRMLQTGFVPTTMRDSMQIAFVRGGYSTGYAYGDVFGLMSYDLPSNNGLFSGTVTRTDGDTITISSTDGRLPRLGDGVKVLRAKNEIGGGRIADIISVKDSRCVFKLSVTLNTAAGDRVYITQRSFDINEIPPKATPAAPQKRLHYPSSNVITLDKQPEYTAPNIVEVQRAEELKCLSFTPDIAVLNPPDYTKVNDIVGNIRALSGLCGCVYLKLPMIARGDDISLIRRVLDACKKMVSGIYADNLYAITLATEANLPIIAGFGLNITNSFAYDYYARFADYVCVSAELNSYEIAELVSAKRGLAEPIVFTSGRYPVMHLAHCITAAFGRTSHADCKYTDGMSLRDRRTAFPIVRTRAANCYFTLYNSVPHMLAAKVDEKYGKYHDLCAISNKEAALILAGTYRGSFTNGHYKKGV